MHVLFFGDSLTLGHGDPELLGWPGRLYPRGTARHTFYNLGVRSDSSWGVKCRWPSESAVRIPAEAAEAGLAGLVFSFGVVDARPGEDSRSRIPAEETLRNARAVLSEAVRMCPTLFVGPAPVREARRMEHIAALDPGLAGVCEQTRVPYLSLLAALGQGDYLDDLADGVHPGSRGYGLIARLVREWQPWRRWMAKATCA